MSRLDRPMSSHPSLDLPRRVSLSSQAADTIRKAIRDGTWKDSVPSERRLCELLQISRPTVRTALHLLAKDGIIATRMGRRNRLISRSSPTPLRHSRVIGLVTPQPVSQMTFVAYQGITVLRAHLTERGFATEILVCPAVGATAERRKVEEFVRRNRIFCCVLLSVSKQMQDWFSSQSMPALVLGSCHPDVKLPSLDIDYRSVCRHAAGTFLGHGHRRLGLVVPDSGVAGDLASEQGFLEALAQRRGYGDARAVIVRHNGTARDLSARLDRLFDATAPTALLVAKPQHVFFVIIYLLKRGLSVPDTVSFIARDHDPLFETVSPPISHYRFEEEKYTHRLSRLMLKMVDQGYLPAEPNLIFPKFYKGGTVRRVV
jgi:LacI family transcriptional regulator